MVLAPEVQRRPTGHRILKETRWFLRLKYTIRITTTTAGHRILQEMHWFLCLSVVLSDRLEPESSNPGRLTDLAQKLKAVGSATQSAQPCWQPGGPSSFVSIDRGPCRFVDVCAAHRTSSFEATLMSTFATKTQVPTRQQKNTSFGCVAQHAIAGSAIYNK